MSLLSLFATDLDQEEYLWQYKVHVREKTSLILCIDFGEQLHHGHRLYVDNLMNHLENFVGKLYHGFGDVLNDFLDDNEEWLVENIFVLFEHGHQNRDKHRHEGHRVRLVFYNVADAVQANFMMIA